jgi:predicted small lipoprotein YifL
MLRAHAALVSVGFSAALLLAPSLAACGAKTGLLIPDAETDAPIDGGFDAAIDGSIPGRCAIDDPIDVLFVIDSSQSMEEEQESLAAEMPRLVEALVRPPDLDADGVPDWNPVTNLHLGVVTTDLGAGGVDVGTCERRRGDDAILRDVGNASDLWCLRRFPRFLEFGGVTSEESALIRDLACVIAVGDDGCGQEQPLEAVLKALTPSTSPLRFEGNTVGHGDGVNAGFLREGSFLAVVIVTDEDDCSTSDPRLFDPESTRYTEHPNVRCGLHEEEALQPIDRFLDNITALRRGASDRLALALIAGVPVDLVSDGDPLYTRVLADPRMRFMIDPMDETSPVPSCDVPGRGVAYPPVRLVRAARELAPASTVQSICQVDLRPAVAALVELIGLRTCEGDSRE